MIREFHSSAEARFEMEGATCVSPLDESEAAMYTLKPLAREKLAKAAGILIAYPGLSIEVDGHTDNVTKVVGKCTAETKQQLTGVSPEQANIDSRR